MQSDRRKKIGGDDRRTEILKAAAELFASSGFRVSLQEIANSCGILAGSLYHHFDSKEKIVEELLLLYQKDLKDTASAVLEELKQDNEKSDFERILTLAEAIVECAAKHRAALLQTYHDGPQTADDHAASMGILGHDVIVKAMLDTLQSARANGYLRKESDLPKLAEQICQSMLNFAVGTFRLSPGAKQVPRIKCLMLLEGLADKAPSNSGLERSPAFRAAEATIASWNQTQTDEQMAALCRAARSVFGRLGFEGATIRDIAAASNMSTGAIYRMVGSKDKLLALVMEPYTQATTTAWDALMETNSTPVEKLDAMLWTGIHLLNRFSEEFVIQLAWLRENPPMTWDKTKAFGRRLSYIKKLLTEGQQSGAIRDMGASLNIQAYCLMELIWMSKSIVRRVGVWASLTQARETLLRGAVKARN